MCPTTKETVFRPDQSVKVDDLRRPIPTPGARVEGLMQDFDSSPTIKEPTSRRVPSVKEAVVRPPTFSSLVGAEVVALEVHLEEDIPTVVAPEVVLVSDIMEAQLVVDLVGNHFNRPKTSQNSNWFKTHLILYPYKNL